VIFNPRAGQQEYRNSGEYMELIIELRNRIGERPLLEEA
jgi:hypothetical protein